MAEALRLDIVIDPSGQARDVLVDLWAKFVKAGDTAEEASRKVEKFEKALADNAAKKEAKKSLDDLAKAKEQVGKQSEAAEPKVKLLTSAIARYVTAGAVLGAIKATVNWADGLKDLSVQTGLSTSTLQQWGRVAQSHGKTMEDMARAAQNLGADLVQGDKSVVKGITAMGLSIEELLRLNPEARMREVARAISEIEDPAIKAARAQDVFKRSGTELLTTLEDLAKESDKTALALGDDWIEAGAILQDVWDSLVHAAKTAGAAIVLAFPKSMLDGLREWQTILQSIGVMAESAGPGLPGNPLRPRGPAAFDPLGGRSMRDIERELTEGVGRAVKETERAYRDLERQVDRTTAAQKRFTDSVRPMNGYVTGIWVPLKNAVEDTRDEMVLLVDSLSDAVAAQGRMKGMITDLWVPLKAAVQEVRPEIEAVASPAAGRNWEGIYDGAMRVVGAFQHMAQVLSQVRTNGQAAMGALTGFDTGMGLAGSLGLSGGAAGALGIFGAVAALAVGLNNARQAARNYRDALSRASLDMQRTMFDIGPELTSRLSPERHEEFQRLSDITYPSESQLERMADIIGEMRLRIVETNDAFADLAARMERAGMRMPQHFRDAADHLRNLGVLTKENAKLLDGLMNRAPDWRLMQQTAEKFGIDIDSLGKSFQGGRIGARAQELIDAWELLTKGAPEAQGGVLFGMKDELQSLLNDALRHGLTLPENLRPLFEELLRTNQLTDPFTGEALQGMHEIRFGPAVLTEFEKISQDMEAFLRTLGIDVTSSIDRGSQAIVDAVNNIRIDVDWSTNPGGQLPRERFDDGEGRAMGTFGATGRFDPEDFGAGTWMRLHGRETIVREDQREAFADDVIRERGEDRNTTRPGGDVYLIPISAERDDDRELARVIRDIANNRGGSKIRLRDALYRRGEDRRVRL